MKITLFPVIIHQTFRKKLPVPSSIAKLKISDTTSANAQTAAIWKSITTPAGTGTVPTVRPCSKKSGWINAKPK